MDNSTDSIDKESQKQRNRLISLIINLPVLWLIYHLTSMTISGAADQAVLDEFVRYREYFYQIYAVLLVFVGIFIMINQHNSSRQPTINTELSKNNNQKVSNVTVLLPELIVSIILITFSYSISDMIFKFILRVNLTSFFS